MTIPNTPPAYASAHDDLVFTLLDAHASDPTTYPNYKYILDVYINGTMVARLKKEPLPDTLIGHFNISQIVRNYISANFKPTLNLVSQQMGLNEFYIDLQVKAGEEYSYTSYYNLVTSTSQKVYNNYNKQLYGTATSLSGLEDEVISNAPTALEAYLNQGYSFLTYFPTSTSSVSIQIINSQGNVFNTSIMPSTAFFAQVLNISPQTINNLSAGLINANTRYYTVKIGEDTYRVDLVCEPRYNTYELHFLNQYGGWDTKLFNKVSHKTVTSEKSGFGVLPYTIDNSGIVHYYDSNNVYSETKHIYASLFTEKLILNSDLLTDEEYIWLQDLIISPLVYLNQNGYFYSVNITDSNYEPKKRVNEGLTNLVLNLELGKQLNAQFR